MIPATQCPSSALRVTVNKTRGGAAAGTSYVALDFTNTSGHSCDMFGFPGVSFVTGNPGSQIGAAASRQKTFGPENVRLASGAVAHAWLGVVDAGNFSPSACGPVTAHWLKVFPPDQFTALYTRFTAQVCSKKVSTAPADHPADQAGARGSRPRAVAREPAACSERIWSAGRRRAAWPPPTGTGAAARSRSARTRWPRSWTRCGSSRRPPQARSGSCRSPVPRPRAPSAPRPDPPVLGLHGPALLGALTRLLGSRRPARSGRPGHLERPRAWRRLRADQPAARGRAGAAGQRVAVPADEPAVHQPAVPADRGHPRVRACWPPPQREQIAALAAPLRAAQRHRGPDRPGRGLGGQARRPGDHPPRPLAPGAAGRVRAVPRPRGPRRSTTGPPGARWPRCTGPTGGSGRPRLRDPRSAAVAAERARLAGRPQFHAWLQWLADEQRAAAQQAARAAGMDIGVIGDLAVGAHPGGADAWAGQDVMVRGVSVGAPPDEFNQRGQDWALPPWHPRPAGGGRLPAAGRPDRRRARPRGGMRADHVMGLLRLWWVPAGMTAGPRHLRPVRPRGDGRRAGRPGGAGRRARHRRGPRHRRALDPRATWPTAACSAPRCSGSRRAPTAPRCRRAGWRRDCLATVGTHDVPPAAALRHRRARGAARPARAAGQDRGCRTRPTRPPPSPPGGAPWRGRACSPRAQPRPGRVHRRAVRLPGPHPGRR